MKTALLPLFDVINLSGIIIELQYLFQCRFHFMIIFQDLIKTDVRDVERIAVVMRTDSQCGIGIHFSQAALVFKRPCKGWNCKHIPFGFLAETRSDFFEHQLAFGNHPCPAVIELLNTVSLSWLFYFVEFAVIDVFLNRFWIFQQLYTKTFRSIQMRFIECGRFNLHHFFQIITGKIPAGFLGEKKCS